MPMGWRFLVLADLGGKGAEPVRVLPGAGPGAVSPAVELEAGGRRLRLDLADEKAFEPAALAAHGDADAILHHPSFQGVESAWRGIHLLLREAEGAVEVEVLSASRRELLDRFRAGVFDRESREVGERPIGLILADYDFSGRGADLAALDALGEMAAGLQAPLVAGAAPGFFDLSRWDLLPKLSDLPRRLSSPALAGWQAFQKGDRARWVALTVNRYLQRAPHAGEKVDPARPETFLWGRGAWLVGAAAARSVKRHGHALDLSGGTGGSFPAMPARDFPKLANQTARLSTEVPIPEERLMELSRLGFTPLVGVMGADAVLLPMAVTAYRSAAGKLTVTGTLAYQMTMGRLANFLALALEGLPSGPEAAPALRNELVGFLGPLAGDKPEDAVQVEVKEGRDAEGRAVPLAAIRIAPAAKLEGLDFRFTFEVPLR